MGKNITVISVVINIFICVQTTVCWQALGLTFLTRSSLNGRALAEKWQNDKRKKLVTNLNFIFFKLLSTFSTCRRKKKATKLFQTKDIKLKILKLQLLEGIFLVFYLLKYIWLTGQRRDFSAGKVSFPLSWQNKPHHRRHQPKKKHPVEDELVTRTPPALTATHKKKIKTFSRLQCWDFGTSCIFVGERDEGYYSHTHHLL